MEETTGLSKQQKKPMETKAKIFKAAKRILQRSGYETLSIKNICEEAGVSNGSFYHHFKTKDDLLSYYIEDQPSINPDLLDLPENAEDAKRTIIQVYLNYVSIARNWVLSLWQDTMIRRIRRSIRSAGRSVRIRS